MSCEEDIKLLQDENLELRREIRDLNKLINSLQAEINEHCKDKTKLHIENIKLKEKIYKKKIEVNK